MAQPKETVWALEPHTRAKHEILKRYLQAWMVILSQGRFPEILYVDGFAGPGEYSGGEAGSPIIALETALDYEPPLQARVHFLFVERDRSRAEHLRRLVEARALPPNFSVVIEEGATFEEAFERRYLEFVRNGRLIPTFAFVDPFGWKGVPFSLITKILAHRSCEVFVNFMYEEINRFLGHPDQVGNFRTFFETDDWRQCISETNPQRRNRCLHDLYMNQLLREAKARYVRSFEMSNQRDVTDYFLFYATNEILGLKKMKEAMWKTDESGEFRFSDATDPSQTVLFQKEPNYALLKSRLVREFAGKEVSVADIERYVVVDTAFRETHYKSILKALEATGGVSPVNVPVGRKKGTFGDPSMKLKFS